MTTYDIYKLATLSGLFYYFYNEVAFLALSEVTALQHKSVRPVKLWRKRRRVSETDSDLFVL